LVPYSKITVLNFNDEALWTGMGEYIITASKEDIELNFYLGVSKLFYYCSVGIRLSGKLGDAQLLI